MKALTLLLAGLTGAAVMAAATNVSAEPTTAAGPARTVSKGIYDIREFGAVGDGQVLDSPAIDRAIKACSEAGGGTVYVPPGTFLCGSIHLRSCVNLHLETGAKILGAPQSMLVYDPAEPFVGPAYQDGGHCYFHNSLIWGENLTNVSITGLGLIDGGGLIHSNTVLDRISGYTTFGTTNFANFQTPSVPENELRLGNKAIALKRCRHVLMRDFTIFHGGHFAILVTGCDDMTIDNVTLDTSRDGMDLDCCRNTVVSNCRVNSPTDDGICPKSSYALGEPVITENLTIVNCQVSGFEEGTLLDSTMKPSRQRTGRIKFGTEATGGFRNCTVANCTFRCCRGLALEQVDGGVLENITINNISMVDVAHYPIYITTGSRNRGPGVTQPGKLRNIFISNVVATGIDAMSGIQITGVENYPIEGVRLDNIRFLYNGGGTREQAARKFPELGRGYPEPNKLGILPAYGLLARHVRDLELANIRFGFIQEDLRPALVFEDVEGLEIDNLKAQTAAAVPPARFEQVKDLVVRNSPGLEPSAK